MKHEIDLAICGLGVILYSPFAVEQIREGEDYLQSHFWDPGDVARHVGNCTLTCFCTGSPGDYHFVLFDGFIDDADVARAEFKVRLGLEIRDRSMCLRDLYDLLAWQRECPRGQELSMCDGFYRLTVYSSRSASGIIGDHQSVFVHFENVDKPPELAWRGVPQLCPIEK